MHSWILGVSANFCLCVCACMCIWNLRQVGFMWVLVDVEKCSKIAILCLMLWELCVSVFVYVSACVICWLWNCKFCQLHTCRAGAWGLEPTSVCVYVHVCAFVGFMWVLVDVEKCSKKIVIIVCNVMGVYAMCISVCVHVCTCHMLVVKLQGLSAT